MVLNKLMFIISINVQRDESHNWWLPSWKRHGWHRLETPPHLTPKISTSDLAWYSPSCRNGL